MDGESQIIITIFFIFYTILSPEERLGCSFPCEESQCSLCLYTQSLSTPSTTLAMRVDSATQSPPPDILAQIRERKKKEEAEEKRKLME